MLSNQDEEHVRAIATEVALKFGKDFLDMQTKNNLIHDRVGKSLENLLQRIHQLEARIAKLEIMPHNNWKPERNLDGGR